ncbi:hypothetical protein HRG_002093 [Hirsutella rhossiliensis]|uniref:Uncharacterized protein n=1 Tax=Hirsutella rhossiliensis TaxID=111463 RepID=A0A9P8N4J1_9HYPO|nr:uncharacterized protein HRG_02093 [Hirsutella rhossiliensis]KAH0966684.1 hypothetical protein HRG_02093 [Hirsutella rhossiliensis]
MAQDQGALGKVGRGGAGNYHPTSPPEQADEATAKPLPAHEAAVVAAPDAPGPLRGGRGGAGNFVDPGELPDASEAAREVGAAVSRSRKQHGRGRRGGMGGRGGAGNWAGRSSIRHGSNHGDDYQDDDDGDGYVDDEWDEVHGPRAQKVEALERKVKEAVDKGLRIPDKVHHGSDRAGYE